MKRRLITLAALAAASLGGLVATTPAPAAAATNCLLTVENIDGVADQEVQSQELNEREDDIFLRIGDKKFPSSGTVAFSSSKLARPASAFGNPKLAFVDEVKMEVIEKDPLFNDAMGVNFIPCAPLSSTLVFNDGGKGAYTVEVKVVEL
jgi:hypothetical protein